MDRVSRVQIVPREPLKLVRGPSDPLVLLLEPLPDFRKRGIYGVHKDELPDRYHYLHPDAATSLRALEANYPGVFYYSDVFRNASGSKKRREKNKAKRISQNKSAVYTGLLPGLSGHGFGLCVDHDVTGNLRRLRGFAADRCTKQEYDEILRAHGWYCYRDGPEGDHDRGPEDWHYNYFGDDPDRWLSHSHRTTARGIEAKIQALYGPFVLSPEGVSTFLSRLKYPDVTSFQRDWTLAPDGVAGPITQRVLLYVCALFRDTNGATLSVPFP